MNKNILIYGAGYVGLSLSVLLAKRNSVFLIDKDDRKIELINKGISTIQNELVQKHLSDKSLNLKSYTKLTNKIKDIDFIILALPTNFSSDLNAFDTSILEEVIEHIKNNELISDAPIIVKSTVPIGFTDKIRDKYNDDINLFFSPEFLREDSSIEDNIAPSRIVIGSNSNAAIEFGHLLREISENNPQILFMRSIEAEAVKLFSNSFLATRVSFFNELDSFAYSHDLDAKSVINGVSSDPRIGNYYNNPSFGYGGYCLPKDSKQLLTSFKEIPQNIFKAVIDSNIGRKKFIAREILKKKPKTVGIYRLTMKSKSDNFRESAVMDIIKLIADAGIEVIVYEPILSTNKAFNIENSLEKFKLKSEIILANRYHEDLNNVSHKTFTRDIFKEN